MIDMNESDEPIDDSLLNFAAKDSRQCADEVINRCNDYWNTCSSSGLFELWRRLYYSYNPNRYTLGQTSKAGTQSDYRVIRVNHFRNLIDHIQTLTITDRPAWEPQSANSDSKTQKQTIIARGILDYYMRQDRVERQLFTATRNAMLFGEGFILLNWNQKAGEPIGKDIDTGEVKYAGDLEYSTLEPVDVVRDMNLKDFYLRDWVVTRSYVNKYDLAKQFEEYASEIVNQTYEVDADNHYLGYRRSEQNTDTDLIPMLTFYHSKTRSVPAGRQMTLLVDGTILSDTDLLYSHIPLQRISAADQIGSPMGSSVAVDLLPIQEMIDAHYTGLLSVNEHYSIPKIVMPFGSNIQSDSMESGFTVIEYDPAVGPPSVMEMPMASDGYYKALQKLQQDMETISGVNSVSRGNPEASLKSGSALALVQSMAIQFHAPLQRSYIAMLEDVGTATINILKDFADEPRMIQIAGKRNKGIFKQAFSKDDLSSISQVLVQAGNPLSKTTSGKISIAETLMQNKLIKTPEEYLLVLQTGQLDNLIQGETQVLLNLATENDYLLEGKPIYARFTDDHLMHITEHTALASDPTLQIENPEGTAALDRHIQEHLKFLMDPQFAPYFALTNQPSLANQAPPGQPPQGPQPQPGAATQMNAATQPPNGTTSSGPMGATQVQEKAASVNMPNQPKNALTGERPPGNQ
jgi:hypothetical protein